MSVKTFYVVNPRASNGKARRLWARLLEGIERRGVQAAYELTRFVMHATEITAAALESGYDAIVAVGGDGTFNEVLNGFYRGGRPIRPDACLAYLPCGTGRDLARTLGFAGSLAGDLVQRLAGGGVVRLDHGLARFRNREGVENVRYFMNEASAGFSASTVALVNRSSKALGGKLTFLSGALRTLSRLTNPVMSVEVDGTPWYEGPVFLAAAANGQYFGGSMRIAPQAIMDDSRLDVVLIEALSRLQVVRHIGRIYSGEHVVLPQVRMTRGRTVRIRSAERVPIEMDGEHPGFLDAQFEVVEGGVRFLMPVGTA